MDDVWDTDTRINAIHQVINRTPHDQTPVGIGFKLVHSPTVCIRCRANIAILELESLIDFLEWDSLALSREMQSKEGILH